MELKEYLIVGSYLLGAASWGFLYKELKTIRLDVLKLREDLIFERGKAVGREQERDQRLVRLEARP